MNTLNMGAHYARQVEEQQEEETMEEREYAVCFCCDLEYAHENLHWVRIPEPGERYEEAARAPICNECYGEERR